jgi:hypothetical protein
MLEIIPTGLFIADQQLERSFREQSGAAPHGEFYRRPRQATAR